MKCMIHDSPLSTVLSVLCVTISNKATGVHACREEVSNLEKGKAPPRVLDLPAALLAFKSNEFQTVTNMTYKQMHLSVLGQNQTEVSPSKSFHSNKGVNTHMLTHTATGSLVNKAICVRLLGCEEEKGGD